VDRLGSDCGHDVEVTMIKFMLYGIGAGAVALFLLLKFFFP
jgi:hypothetical protein